MAAAVSAGPDGISVVIPHRDCPHLASAVDSVIRQGLRRPHEIIVADDCSRRPESTRALEDLASTGRARVIGNSEHQGVQRVRNQGIAAARYGYVLLLDADDMLREPGPGTPSFPERAAEIMDSDSSVAFVHTGSWMTGGAQGPTIGSYPLEPGDVARKHHVPVNILVSRADLGTAPCDESVAKWQDWSLAVEVLARRWRRGLPSRIGFVPGNLHLYRIHSDGERVSQGEADEYEMTLRTVRRHCDWFSHFHQLGMPAEDLAKVVLGCKPTKLQDLLRMASFDLPQALELAMLRDAVLVSPLDELGIP